MKKIIMDKIDGHDTSYGGTADKYQTGVLSVSL
jgi:hypothetical protein